MMIEVVRTAVPQPRHAAVACRAIGSVIALLASSLLLVIYIQEPSDRPSDVLASVSTLSTTRQTGRLPQPAGTPMHRTAEVKGDLDSYFHRLSSDPNHPNHSLTSRDARKDLHSFFDRLSKGILASPLDSLASLASQPPAPKLPAGWEASWDAPAHKYYFFNKVTKETTWNEPQDAPAKKRDLPWEHHAEIAAVIAKISGASNNEQKETTTTTINLSKDDAAKLGLETPGPLAIIAEDADNMGVNTSDIPAVIQYWKHRGDKELQEAKDRGFDAAVASNWDNYDIAKGRAINKEFHGKQGGGEGYWPYEAPYYPKPGDVPHQGLKEAVASYDEYDATRGIAIIKNGRYDDDWGGFLKQS